jgi:hypothetical protein
MRSFERLPSLRSHPLRRLPNRGQLHTSRGYQPSGLRCLLSVSHALKALLRPRPPSLISCWSRPWGLPFRVEFHSRSRTLSRAPMPSCGSLTSLFAVSVCSVKPTSRSCQQSRTYHHEHDPVRSEPHFRALLTASVRTSNRWFRPE